MFRIPFQWSFPSLCSHSVLWIKTSSVPFPPPPPVSTTLRLQLLQGIVNGKRAYGLGFPGPVRQDLAVVLLWVLSALFYLSQPRDSLIHPSSFPPLAHPHLTSVLLTLPRIYLTRCLSLKKPTLLDNYSSLLSQRRNWLINEILLNRKLIGEMGMNN